MPKAENMTASQLANLESHKWKKGQSGNPAGKKPNRVAKLLKEILPKNKLKKTQALTADEIDFIEKGVLALELADLQLMAKADATPAYAKTLAMAIIIDMKNGKTTTVDTLRNRQYGTAVQQIDVTSGGAAIQRQRSLTQEEAKQLLQQLEEEY